MGIPNHIIRQLGNPAGLLGRFILWRLNDVNLDMNDRTFEALEVQKDDRVLEIGFGGASLLDRILASEPSLVAGAEISDLALAKARKRHAAAIAAGHLELSEIPNDGLPYSSGAFSKACCVNVIYFWDDVPAMMAEVLRVLQSKGRFVVCYEGAGPNDRETSPELVEHYLTQAGFEVLETLRERDRRDQAFFCTTAVKPSIAPVAF